MKGGCMGVLVFKFRQTQKQLSNKSIPHFNFAAFSDSRDASKRTLQILGVGRFFKEYILINYESLESS